MTRTELKSKANMLMLGTYWPMERVNKCKCWVIWAPDESLAIIQSYATAVAIYSAKSKRLYVFDYYSNTTQQHIRKAAKILYALEIRYLYRRSDKIVLLSTAYNGFGVYKPSNFEYILEHDWDMFIEDEISWNY